jgi:hypothetical protein
MDGPRYIRSFWCYAILSDSASSSTSHTVSVAA